MDWAQLGRMVGAGLATTVGGLALLAVRAPGDRPPDVLAAARCPLLVPAPDRGTVADVTAGAGEGAAGAFHPAFAAGAMLPLVAHERTPERGSGRLAQPVPPALLVGPAPVPAHDDATG